MWQFGKVLSTLAQLERNINAVSQKMLLEQLNELLDYQVIDKHTFEGYPLKVEYCLTKRGTRLLQAIKIMQEVGIDLMKES